MDIRLVILSIVILILVVFPVVYFSVMGVTSVDIRKEVLSQLEDKLEFCEIMADDVDISGSSGLFWLNCNGRPFYAEYDNGNTSYEMNGWSFLKNDNKLWLELRDCDFYDSRNSELIFYCPKDFDSDVLDAKIYDFNQETLSMIKLEQSDFLDILSSDIKKVYSFLSECTLYNFTSYRPEGYPPFILLIFSCDDGNYLVGTDLTTVPIQPPILLDSILSNEERARTSFEKSFGYAIDNATSSGEYVTIASRNSFFTYKFGVIPSFKYILNCPAVDVCLEEFGKFFILPLVNYEDIEFIKEIQGQTTSLIYTAGKDIISVEKDDIYLRSFRIKGESLDV